MTPGPGYHGSAMAKEPVPQAVHRTGGIARLYREASRRRVFRVAGLYIIGAWLVLQVADVVFPGLGIPDGAIGVLLVAFLLGFPLALVFGWLYDIGPGGIRRTRPVIGEAGPVTLRVSDHAILVVFLLVAGLIVYNATRDVLEMPREEATQADAAGTGEALPQLENSIAVLPFANLSPDPENEYFCDGLSEEILNRLGAFEELNIIGRTSSFAFKGRDVGAPGIASALGVKYLLQGSVRRSGDRLRITAQLLDENGLQRWTERFDRELTDVFAIQEEIADRVAVTVVPQVSMTTPQGRPPLFAAYELYLQGRELLHKRQIGLAIPLLREAVDLDPDFAEAYAELAFAEVYGSPLPEEEARGEELIERALSLKPGLLRALEVQGLILKNRGEPARAEAVLREVVSQYPNRVDTLNWLAGVLAEQGRTAEADRIAQRAYRIDPLHGAVAPNLARRAQENGDLERARAILTHLVDNVPDSRNGYSLLASTYRAEGRLAEVQRILRRAVLNRAMPHYVQHLLNSAALGDWTSAETWLTRQKRDHPGSRWTPYIDGFYAQARGRYQAAAEAMNQAWAIESRRGDYIRLVVGGANILAGHHVHGISLLEPALGAKHEKAIDWLVFAQHLAWAYLQTGQHDKATHLVALLDAHFRKFDLQGRLATLPLAPDDDGLYRDALNARLQGDLDLALERLQRAAEHGWADYYIRHHDPRWDVLRDHPRFQAIMAGVKARVDRMAAEAERQAPASEFFSKLDAVMAPAASQ